MDNKGFDRETESFDVHHRYKIDCAGDGCATINVSRNERGNQVKSLWHLRDEVKNDIHRFNRCTKLYVLGEWVFAFDANDPVEEDPDGVSGRVSSASSINEEHELTC
jgi:hypothetical protein